jgi:hypothetical protein
MLTDAHKEARTAIATELLHQKDAGIEGLLSHCCVMKLGFSSVNQTAVDETMSHDFPRKACKVMGSVLLDEKGVIVMNSLPRWVAVNSYELS